MDDLELFKRLGLALAIGLLVGLERGWHARSVPTGTRIAGIRSFALIALLGGMSGLLATTLGASAFGFAFVAFAALVAAGYWTGNRGQQDFGITTEIAALLVFVLGAAAMLSDMALAAAGGVVTTALLAIKPTLHRWIDRIEELDLAAGIKLAVISVVMLPLLPDRAVGPGGVLNPYELWWAVVLVAGLSFVGYVAVRITGAQLGTLITGLLGGLVSSTATTLSFARMASRAEALAPVLAMGAVLAGSVTFLRILALTSVLNPALAGDLAVPMLTMAATGFVGALVLRVAPQPHIGITPDVPEVTNPLELGVALKFGILLALVVLITHYFEVWFGTAGVYTVAALSGITDVDAVTVSMARMSDDMLTSMAAAGAVMTAVSVNSAVKAGIALAVGGRRFGLRVSAVYAAVLVVGGFVSWLR